MSEQEPPRLDLLEITPIRCDVNTHRNLLREARRSEANLRNPARVRITTPDEEVAKRIKQLTVPTEIPVTSNDNHAKDSEAEIKKRNWDRAVGKAVQVVTVLTQTEAPDVVNNNITALFDGLRDPDRRDVTMQTVEVLYEEHVSPTTE